MPFPSLRDLLRRNSHDDEPVKSRAQMATGRTQRHAMKAAQTNFGLRQFFDPTSRTKCARPSQDSTYPSNMPMYPPQRGSAPTTPLKNRILIPTITALQPQLSPILSMAATDHSKLCQSSNPPQPEDLTSNSGQISGNLKERMFSPESSARTRLRYCLSRSSASMGGNCVHPSTTCYYSSDIMHEDSPLRVASICVEDPFVQDDHDSVRAQPLEHGLNSLPIKPGLLLTFGQDHQMSKMFIGPLNFPSPPHTSAKEIQALPKLMSPLISVRALYRESSLLYRLLLDLRAPSLALIKRKDVWSSIRIRRHVMRVQQVVSIISSPAKCKSYRLEHTPSKYQRLQKPRLARTRPRLSELIAAIRAGPEKTPFVIDRECLPQPTSGPDSMTTDQAEDIRIISSSTVDTDVSTRFSFQTASSPSTSPPSSPAESNKSANHEDLLAPKHCQPKSENGSSLSVHKHARRTRLQEDEQVKELVRKLEVCRQANYDLNIKYSVAHCRYWRLYGYNKELEDLLSRAEAERDTAIACFLPVTEQLREAEDRRDTEILAKVALNDSLAQVKYDHQSLKTKHMHILCEQIFKDMYTRSIQMKIVKRAVGSQQRLAQAVENMQVAETTLSTRELLLESHKRVHMLQGTLMQSNKKIRAFQQETLALKKALKIAIDAQITKTSTEPNGNNQVSKGLSHPPVRIKQVQKTWKHQRTLDDALLATGQSFVRERQENHKMQITIRDMQESHERELHSQRERYEALLKVQRFDPDNQLDQNMGKDRADIGTRDTETLGPSLVTLESAPKMRWREPQNATPKECTVSSSHLAGLSDKEPVHQVHPSNESFWVAGLTTMFESLTIGNEPPTRRLKPSKAADITQKTSELQHLQCMLDLSNLLNGFQF